MDFSGLTTANYSDLIAFVQGGLNLVISISALIAVISLVKAGIEYILSAGDETKIEKAQKSLIYTLIGLIMVFIAPLIIKFVLERVIVVS